MTHIHVASSFMILSGVAEVARGRGGQPIQPLRKKPWLTQMSQGADLVDAEQIMCANFAGAKKT